MARPVGNAMNEQLPVIDDEAPCDKAESYTVQWFLDHALSKYNGAFNNTALFYSRGMSTRAIEYAKQQHLITIWDVWECRLYAHYNISSNPMRCIHNDPDQRTAFYGNMSQAFALKASGALATVMHSAEDFKHPPTTGIWARIELPTVKNKTSVGRIKKIDPEGNLSEVFWERPGHEANKIWNHDLEAAVKLPTTPTASRRRDVQPYNLCMAPGEYDFYDRVEW